MCIDTLQSPFYDRMIGSMSSNFSDMVIIGERIEIGIKKGRIGESTTGTANSKKVPFVKKKEKETQAIMVDQRKNQAFINSPSGYYTPPSTHPQYNQPYIATTTQTPTTTYEPSYYAQTTPQQS